VIGVNTFFSSEGSPTTQPREVIRSTETEKEAPIATVAAVQELGEIGRALFEVGGQYRRNM
jgi:methylmalonyl-CoA mutase